MAKNTLQLLVFPVLILVLFLAPSAADAQKKKKKGKKSVTEMPVPKEDGEKTKTIEEATKRSIASEGLFTVYRDTVNGSAQLLIKKDQLDKEYIYFVHVADGVADVGRFTRGAYVGSRIFRIKKYYNKIEFVFENTSYYFDEKSALSKAADANINKPIFFSGNITAESEDKSSYIINADQLFLTENFQQIKPAGLPSIIPLPIFSVGMLNSGKTKYDKIRNYQKNLDVVVNYSFDNPSPVVAGSQAVTDSRYVTLKVQHSLIEVPQNNYKLRKDDPRIGFFSTQITNQTSTDVLPYRDIIHRWHLEKKDKNAKLSEPVKPITWWIENTTPIEFRDIIKEGVLRWNTAFEKAGFKNAVEVRVQPDDADWDAGDIRYNVLRWTASPQPQYGGYGPSFVNPRTGQILGADVMLEFSAITKRLQKGKYFETDASSLFTTEVDERQCTAGKYLHHSYLAGLHLAEAGDMPFVEQKEFLKQILYRLVLHEVGHTLGMSHNMKGSFVHSPEEVKNKDVVDREGLCNSVMEYPAINFPSKKEDYTLLYDVKPGAYDDWVIEYGYSEAVNNDKEEETRLNNILARSTDPMLLFGNDADDMRSPGKGIDPRVNIYDLTNDPVKYGTERIKLVNSILPKIKAHYSKGSQSYHELRNAFLTLTTEQAIQLGVITRQIGGVYVDRSFTDQSSSTKPFEPVPREKQKQAMAALAEYGFGVKAFNVPEELYNYLQAQRRGFNHLTKTEDLKIHNRALAVQKSLFDHLLHANVLNRIIDSELYGNKYQLSEFTNDLTNAVFKDDLKGKVSYMRQNLQIEYATRLVDILSPEKSESKSSDLFSMLLKGSTNNYSHPVRSQILYELKKIDRMMSTASSPDTATKAHRQHVRHLIKKTLEQ